MSAKALGSKIKNILIVYGHQGTKSFNHALKDVAVTSLTDCGHNVTVSDLYSMKFNAVSSPNDVVDTSVPPDTRYDIATYIAGKQNKLSDDIEAEWEKLSWADLVIFQFPLYWFHMPAIMKGWCDRVLICGRAYDPTHMYSDGFLKGKKAMLSFTAEATKMEFSNKGIAGDMEVVLWPIHNGIFRFTGMDVLAPNICHAVGSVSQSEREKMLENWGLRLKNVFEEKLLHFLHSIDFEDMKIKDEIVEIEMERKTLPIGQNKDGVFYPTQNVEGCSED